jgi:choline dehydrogenase
MSEENFDYVIIGAGSAGCVLADRLSASGQFKVLVIEAGGSDRRFWIKTPLGYAKTFKDRSVNWSYSAEADAGLNGRRAYWPRGRVLGGSSSINAMAYLRGLPSDFDDWAKAGAIGWDWSSVGQTYEVIETHSELDASGARKTKGSGPIWVSDVSDGMHPFTDHFAAAAKEMGWTVANNLNGEETEGLMKLRSTVRDGRRWSSADAFLRPALKRSNVRLISNALVQNIVLEGKRAVGVRYLHQGRVRSVKAEREIILSAGAINSPQILQLSGIGPADVLSASGVTVRHDLSQVGKGLQDHLGISYFYHSNVPTLNRKLGNWFGQMKVGIRYLLSKRGPLSVPINQFGGFVRSDEEALVADIQIYCNPMSYKTNANGDAIVDTESGFLLCAQPSRPTSRGEINITSADPTAAPSIQPNSLSTEYDREMAVKAGRILQKMAQTPAICAVTKARQKPDVVELNDAELLEDFRERAGTIFHPTSTCRMGQSSADSVLDERLRVHGIAGLRVVDASSFPNVTSGNTNAPTMMLASRGADLILEDAARPIQTGGTQ